jgi:4-aminobutyrate aminotransferase-like enzyme
MAPPLIIETAHVTEAVAILDAALSDAKAAA